MAEQIQVQYSVAAADLYVVIRNSEGAVWDGTTFVAYDTADLGDYDIPLTEQGTASRFYAADMPALDAGLYNVVVFQQAAGAPAETDSVVASGPVSWDGTAFILPATQEAVFTRVFSAAYGSLTFDQLIKIMAAVLAGKVSGLEGTNPVFRNLADSGDVVDATTDTTGNRTDVTLTP